MQSLRKGKTIIKRDKNIKKLAKTKNRDLICHQECGEERRILLDDDMDEDKILKTPFSVFGVGLYGF